MIFHSDVLNENTDSQAAMAQSVEQATGARKVQDSNLAHSALFGPTLGSNANCERIGKKSAKTGDIT